MNSIIASAGDAAVAIAVVAGASAIAGAMAGLALFFMRRGRRSARIRRSHLAFRLTLASWLLLLGGWIGYATAAQGSLAGTFITYLALHIVPFFVLGAYAAWWRLEARAARNDKIRTLSSGLASLRAGQVK